MIRLLLRNGFESSSSSSSNSSSDLKTRGRGRGRGRAHGDWARRGPGQGTDRNTISCRRFFEIVTHLAGCRKRTAFRSMNNAKSPCAAASAEEAVATVGFKAGDADAGRHLKLLEDLAGRGVDASQLAFVVFPGAVPEVAVNPGHAGDEAVGVDRAEDRASHWIELKDLAAFVVAYP